nr:hemerythrin domain-containing protein [Ornithinimicrobium sp. F0845]
MRAVHERLREALHVTREALAAGAPAGEVSRDLLLFCHGFCTALTGHHEGEDRRLFPAIAAAHPELADTLRYLEQDHSTMNHLIGGLQKALGANAPPDELERHLDGLGAIMESHFAYEERQLLSVLETLKLRADPAEVLGPL